MATVKTECVYHWGKAIWRRSKLFIFLTLNESCDPELILFPSHVRGGVRCLSHARLTLTSNCYLSCKFSGLDSGSDLQYTCCLAESGQEGCQVASGGHVHDTNKYCDLEGFLTTLPPAVDTPTDKPRVNVYALDCEMVYTTGGYAYSHF